MTKSFRNRIWLVFIGLAFLVSCSEQTKLELNTLKGQTMGTTFSIKYYSSSTPAKSEKISADVNNKLYELNQSLSTYIPSSELSLFNKLKAGQYIEPSKHLSFMFDESIVITKESTGAFDVTIGPLVNLWGFGPKGRITKKPDHALIRETQSKIGLSGFTKTSDKIIKNKDNVYVDFSAIAKGYAVDEIAVLLDSHQISSYLVEVGGELKAKGYKPDGNSWTVAIEKPVANTRLVQAVLPINNMAMATSGDYRNYFEENGIRYSHTIDGSTGYPIKHRLVSVTVFSETSARADAYATAINVLGPKKGLALAEKYEIPIYMLVKSAKGFEESISSAFAPYQEQMKKFN